MNSQHLAGTGLMMHNSFMTLATFEKKLHDAHTAAEVQRLLHIDLPLVAAANKDTLFNQALGRLDAMLEDRTGIGSCGGRGVALTCDEL